jgi:hypothetical protein
MEEQRCCCFFGGSGKCEIILFTIQISYLWRVQPGFCSSIGESCVLSDSNVLCWIAKEKANTLVMVRHKKVRILEK